MPYGVVQPDGSVAVFNDDDTYLGTESWAQNQGMEGGGLADRGAYDLGYDPQQQQQAQPSPVTELAPSAAPLQFPQMAVQAPQQAEQAPNPLAQALSNFGQIVDLARYYPQQTQYQGPPGVSYPAQPSSALAPNVLAQAPLGGGGLPIRYQPGYQAPIIVQRHEVGHTQAPMPYNFQGIPQWGMEWAQRNYPPPPTYAESYQPGPARTNDPAEIAANLYALGFWNPRTPGQQSSSEDTY